MTYAVKEMFYTLQGEGAHAGTAAVFIRMAGCNMWSGREEDRERDAAKGCCAKWCDTDFRGTDGTHGGRYDAAGLAAVARSLAPASPSSAVAVVTGGEPSLQVDQPLVDALRAVGFAVHMETNGTQPIAADVDWVTVSPKPPAAPRLQRYNEVKAVLADADPEQWIDLAPVRFIQPLWSPIESERRENEARAAQYVMDHPWWKLSVQTHKVLGIR